VVGTLPDGRPSEVRISVPVDFESGHWPLDEPGFVEVAAGGTVTWEFGGLSSGDQPSIRVVAAEPLPGHGQLVFFDPFETLDRAGDEIVGETFPEARGRYRYVVEVERGVGGRRRLRCSPARMGGIDVSGPPVP
jgi:hypothetical protein